MLCRVILFVLTISLSQANIIDCNKIFEQRKDELQLKIDQIKEDKYSFGVLQEAINETLAQKREFLSHKEANLTTLQKNLEKKESLIKSLIDQNQKLLEEIKNIRDDKISKSFAKMKPTAAAAIFDNMEASKAAKILLKLQPRQIAKIMSKMDPLKSSVITDVMKNLKLSELKNQ